VLRGENIFISTLCGASRALKKSVIRRLFRAFFSDFSISRFVLQHGGRIVKK